jgi:predicted DCC family thiol-disulfide oxidoreductase YuxK
MTDGPIILFDAQCVLCSANAQFILRHDRRHRFRLAAMQGAAGAALFRRHGMTRQIPTRSSLSMAIISCGTVTR